MKPNHRRCLSCRQVADRTFFLRVVRIYPSGQIQLDGGMGRSAYICPIASCLQKACQKNRLGRALKAPVSQEIYQNLQQRATTFSQPK
jgi:uncharacterized protein